MSSKFDKELADHVIWFMSNKDRIPPGDLQKRCNFLERAHNSLLDRLLLLARDLQLIEGRSPEKVLWTPAGYKRVPEYDPNSREKRWQVGEYAQ